VSPSTDLRDLLGGPVLDVAPRLLGSVLRHGEVACRITEVEAYDGPRDPGSHAYRGETPRNAVMFGPPGHLYVYFTYGMHYCANVVSGVTSQVPRDDGQAVLLRALAPLAGLDEMRARRRAARRDRDLTNGPGKLCQALGLDRTHDGDDLVVPGAAVWVGDDGVAPPEVPARSTRIGISVARDEPWRWFVAGDPHVSGTRRASG
jgi:DNA-3-methyladenine glycosylase